MFTITSLSKNSTPYFRTVSLSQLFPSVYQINHSREKVVEYFININFLFRVCSLQKDCEKRPNYIKLLGHAFISGDIQDYDISSYVSTVLDTYGASEAASN